MNRKKWAIYTIIVYFCILCSIISLVIIIDPFFHFHAPFKGISYIIANEQYSNNGIVKNFTYNAIITGTSMTENFRTQEVDELFQVQSVRTSFMGEGNKRIAENLENAILYNPDLELVIRGLDTLWFITDKDWMGYQSYPDYLYDDNIWNDVNYVLNKDIIKNNVLPVLKRTLMNMPPSSFDENIFGDDSKSGKKWVLENYKRPAKKDTPVDPADTEMYITLMQGNLTQNILPTIKNNPEITFYIFFPPYSICWWDSLNQEGPGVVQRRINLEYLAIKDLLEYSNVRLFSFFNNYELICNLNNYVDEIHYTSKVNSLILKWMKNGEYQLTLDNYEDYIKQISDFYSDYNYDALFS